MTLALAILGCLFGLSAFVFSIYNFIINLGLRRVANEPVRWSPRDSAENAREITDGQAPSEENPSIYDLGDEEPLPRGRYADDDEYSGY